MNQVLELIRDATSDSPYRGRLYLVGGALRDEYLGLPPSEDVDLVLEGDATALAQFLASRGLSLHAPVVYPRFGTAMLTIRGVQVELVSARAESYQSDSRKPDVKFASLRDDIMRRDFTINTLLRNLHTGETLDITGKAYEDLKAGLIRTPLDPKLTFYDDPLRMLRAIRFATRFGFDIESKTWDSILEESGRLNLIDNPSPVVSAERIRDEFIKIMMTDRPADGMELLRRSNLLRQFLPELIDMIGVTQNAWHLYDVWDHTLRVLGNHPPDAPLNLRLALLLHDVGKPPTRSVDDKGVHFYEHQFVGAKMTTDILRRLKFPNDVVHDVSRMVELHMRLGESRPEWSDAAVKRLIRAVGDHMDALFDLARCDMAAMNPNAPVTDLEALRRRMTDLEAREKVTKITSPLNGREIMKLLNIPPSPQVRMAKDFLVNQILDGKLPADDKTGAERMLREHFQKAFEKHQ
jgi:poly(A) polymerase